MCIVSSWNTDYWTRWQSRGGSCINAPLRSPGLCSFAIRQCATLQHALAGTKMNHSLSQTKVSIKYNFRQCNIVYKQYNSPCTAFWLHDSTQIGCTVSPSSDVTSFLHRFQSQIKNTISCLWDTSMLVSINMTHNLLIPTTIKDMFRAVDSSFKELKECM